KELGTVRNVRLEPASKPHGDGGVHILPFGDPKQSAEESRDLEGEALAHYLRYLVEESDLRVLDPRSHELRRPSYGDIAIMMVATQTVHHLTSELDRIAVPHVVRGGALFMQDPLHQQFVLGLRALSDPRDGVAKAALMRPPFFAVSLEDLVRGLEPESKSEALQAAEALVTELRRDRHRGAPGEVARQVLERTGFGRYVAAGVNGEQRLARLYELCLALDEVGRSARVDFDGVTSIARSWIDAPPRIEAPLPVDAAAVQVITAHQAKGLEWPIVALWDGRAGWRAFLQQLAFTVDAANGEWALKLDGLPYDPTDKSLSKRETDLRAAERKRVAYVAATRARDLLIIPEAGEAAIKYMAGTLIVAGAKQPHQRIAAYNSDDGDWWKRGAPVSVQPMAATQPDLATAWQASAKQALTRRLCPVGITTVAHLERIDVSEPIALEPAPRQRVSSRHGPVFGSTVHRALALLLERGMTPEAATRQAAQENGLIERMDLALADVLRGHSALRAAGLLEHALHAEYPLAGSLGAESLMAG
ncbi:MAG TPA: 3'-5' exonuclease, partial [Polyangiales bacterium]|nr:3'-5' exonuclease [Polyangiales bacterium]